MIADAGRASGVRPDEKPIVAWSFGLFFFVFASWYVLRPLRDAMGLAGNVRDLPHLFLATLGVTLVLAPALSAVVSRYPRRRFLRLAYRFLLGTLLVFFVLLTRDTGTNPLLARAFFVWASVFNLFAITLAWALMADVFSCAQGIRLFALIGGGGTLGAMFGSLVTSILVARAGAPFTLLVAAAFLEAAARCAGRVVVLAPPQVDARAYARGGTLRWLGHVLNSRFFLAICAYLALFTVTSTVLYFEQARIVAARLPDTALRAQLFARIDLAVNGATLALQLFVVGRVVRFFGIATALAALPVLTFACFGALYAAPVLGVLVACQVARRALDLAFTKPAREVLFTVVSPEDKYKAKSLIDTFVYRSGDALGALGFEGLGGSALLGAMGVVCAGWALLGVALGRVTRPATGSGLHPTEDRGPNHGECAPPITSPIVSTPPTGSSAATRERGGAGPMPW